MKSLAFTFIAVFVRVSAFAQETPTLVPFQGRLTDQDGVVVTNGVRVVQFKLYDAPVGGTAVWNGEVQKLTVNNGLISTVLGTKATLSGVNFNQSLCLEITIDANDDGQISLADPPLLPRQSIFSVPAAKFASEAGSLDGFSWSDVFKGGNPRTGTLALGLDPNAVTLTPDGDGNSFDPPLDVVGRIRIRQRPGYTADRASAGLWLKQNSHSVERAFIGMGGDDIVGFFGSAGAGFGLNMNVIDGTVSVPMKLIAGTLNASGANVNSLTAGALTVNGNLSAQGIVAFSRLESAFTVTPRIDLGAGNEVSRYFNALGLFSQASLSIFAPNVYLNGSLWATSDGRLKRNVRRLTNPLEKVGKITAVTYDFDGACSLAKEAKLSLPNETQLGLIAQDVEAVLPEAVRVGENGIRGINYSAVTSLLIEAVKEQQRQIEELRSELAELRKQSK